MIIQSKNVWLKEKLVPAQIEVEEGKIKGIYQYNEKENCTDYGDLWILPGFMDIHCHGYNRAESNTPDEEAFRRWAKHMPHEGVTSFLPTTSTNSYENNMVSLPELADIIDAHCDGAEMVGINIEGNFISHECKGAQDERYIVDPDVNQLKDYQRAARGKVLTVTYAPERDDDFRFVEMAVKMGITASIGHSAASFEQANEAVKHGAGSVTHTGNGMKPFHHRTPGLFGAAITNDRLYAEVIGDGIHVAFGTAQIIGRMKGKDRLILVTDSAAEKDDPAFEKYNRDGAFRLENGTLFGSALYINKGVYNLYYNAHLPLETVINAATINPARCVKVADRKGSLEVGKDGDIVVCDEKFELRQVYCRGIAQF